MENCASPAIVTKDLAMLVYGRDGRLGPRLKHLFQGTFRNPEANRLTGIYEVVLKKATLGSPGMTFLLSFVHKFFLLVHSGPENLNKSRQKKLVKSNKSISVKIFRDQIPFFAISKMAKNRFLNWKNCQKCNFTKKKIDLFDFTSFLAWTF